MHIKNAKSKQLETNSHSDRTQKFRHLILVVVLFGYSLPASAQCAMCRAALEGDANAGKAEAVNDGIVYLMIIPYLLVAGIGFYIYRTGKKLKVKKD